MTMPSEGDPAPAFSAKDEAGNTWNLSKLKGRPAVLYFYPNDDTPGCTTEACGFRDEGKALAELGAIVLGVSRNDAASHRAFKEKHRLNFPLLVDDGRVSDAYGTWGEKNLYGRKSMGMHRTTFLIAPDGRIAKVWTKVRAEGHAEDVLEAVRELARTKKG